jgi:hypothetical protein
LLGAAFVAWQEEDFPMMPNASDFLFTIDEIPDLARWIYIANNQTTQITKRINERNAFWRGNVKHDTDADDLMSTKRWPYMFQMLSYRSVISEYTDLALVLIREILRGLEKYRSRRLKKRKWYSRWFFEFFVGKETWTTYEASALMNKLIPDRNAHLDVIGDSEEN